MINITIIDDEPEIVKLLSRQAENIFNSIGEKCTITTMQNGSEMMHRLTEGHETLPDLLLLDVEMPGISGVDIANKMYDLNISKIIIFVTSHNNFVYESLRYSPFAFVRKFRIAEDLPGEIKRFIEVYKWNTLKLTVIGENGSLDVPSEDVLYVKKTFRKSYVCMLDGHMYLIKESLKNLETIYAKSGFVRTHNGFVVNLKHIFYIDETTLQMCNGESIPVSRDRKDLVQKRFMIHGRC